MASDWDSLPEGVMMEIAERMGVLDDFEALDMVSRRWKSARRMSSYGGMSPQVPWLLLADQCCESPLNPQLFSLSKNNIVVNMTLFLDQAAAAEGLFSSRGWLLVISKEEEEEEEEGNFHSRALSLLNPLLSPAEAVRLPSISSIRYYVGGLFAVFQPYGSILSGRFALSCSPTSKKNNNNKIPDDDKDDNYDEFYVMMINPFNLHIIELWGYGDVVWTPVLTQHLLGNCDYTDIAYCRGLGEFVVTTYERDILACKVDSGAWRTRRRKAWSGDSACGMKEPKEKQDDFLSLRLVANLKTLLEIPGGTGTPFLAVLDDEDDKLLVIACRHRGPMFIVVEVDIVNGKVLEVKDLGNKSIFLGNNEGLCTEASSRYGCKPNCIYFSSDALYCASDDDIETMAVFNLADSSIEFPYEPTPFNKAITPLLWIEPRI